MVTLNVKNRARGSEVSGNGRAIPPQMTLADRISLSGKGLHSGREATVVVHPAPENTGIVFSNGGETIHGLASNVVDTSRGTTIGRNGTRVRTIEHLMAALRGTGVDNALVEVSGPEIPALDGSALPYVEAITEVGKVELAQPRQTVAISDPVWLQRNGSFILAVPSSELRITYVMNYDHPLIGSQSATYVLREGEFRGELAPARTFVLYEEVAELLDNDLARGGSLDNVIVVWRDKLSSNLRFPDELARHKIVDLLGDLSLVGGLLQAEVLAVKSGHALNVDFAKEVQRVASAKSESNLAFVGAVS